MGFLKLRLALAVAAFVLWTVWLAYLAYWTADPIVLSRPQILLAPLIVEAEIDSTAESDVRVVRVWRDDAALLPAGPVEELTIKVENLSATRGYHRPGRYLLALETASVAPTRSYAVVPIPSSPGFPPPADNETQRKKRQYLLKPPIYPANASTRIQLESILRSLPE